MKQLLIVTLLYLTTLPAFSQTNLPSEIKGNWLQPQNNFWQYGFYDHFAMADGSFWNYKAIVRKNNRIMMLLTSSKGQKKIAIEPLPGNKLKIREAGREELVYTKKWNPDPDFARYDTAGFGFPLLKADSVYLTGLISGYDFRKDSFKFIKIIYNPLLEEHQRTFITPIDSLGRFHVNFPLLNPQEVMLSYNHSMIAFYGFPEKKLTICIAPKDIAPYRREENLLFSNETGLFNTERHGFNHFLNPLAFRLLNRKKVDALDEDAYKQFRMDSLKAQFRSLDLYAQKHHSSKTLIQYAKTHLQYWAANDLLRYRWLHKSNDSAQTTTLSDAYLSFLTEIPLNSSLGPVTSSYSGFLHEYLDLKRWELTSHSFTVSFADMIKEAQKHDQRIDPESMGLLTQFARLTASGDTAALAEFREKNDSTLKHVFHRYQPIFQTYASQIISRKREQDLRKVRTFFANSLKPGKGTDVVLARMAMEKIRRNKTLDDKEWAFYRKNIQNKRVEEQIQSSEAALVQRLTHNIPSGAHLLPTLKKAQDSVFNTLIAPYRDQVVYVDFWAPWCGPCMAEMPHLKDLQSRMKGKNVVFLMLGVQSPRKSWINTIKSLEIAGEHHLLSSDEYALLSSRFQISGIPRYLLVDKKGNVVNADADGPGSSKTADTIRQLLESQ